MLRLELKWILRKINHHIIETQLMELCDLAASVWVNFRPARFYKHEHARCLFRENKVKKCQLGIKAYTRANAEIVRFHSQREQDSELLLRQRKRVMNEG